MAHSYNLSDTSLDEYNAFADRYIESVEAKPEILLAGAFSCGQQFMLLDLGHLLAMEPDAADEQLVLAPFDDSASCRPPSAAGIYDVTQRARAEITMYGGFRWLERMSRWHYYATLRTV